MEKILKNKAMWLALIWLIVINAIAIISVNRLNLAPDNAYSWIKVGEYNQYQSWDLVGIHSRWDSAWYLDLAKHGYEINKSNTLSNIVFFPLYPILINMLSVVFLDNFLLAGWFLSCLFLVMSCILLYRLSSEFHKASSPLFSVFLLLIFPTAFFLNSIYTESLFLFLSLAAFYFSYKEKYFWAGLFGFLGSMTRITGILLFLPLLVQVFIKNGFNRQAMRKSIPLLLTPLGTATFFAFHWVYFGDPLLFFKIESAWGRSFDLNKDHFIFLTNASMANFILDSFYLVFAVAIAIYFLKIKKYPYFIYMASTVGVAIATGTLMSIGRYILVLFPIYLLGASIKNEMAKYVWITASAMLMALNTYLFVNWYWAG